APSPNGGPPGDLVITVHVKPHPVFTADGVHLRVTLPVTFDEAVLGAEVEVPTLEGGRVKLKVPSGTSSGKTLRVKGRGLRGKSGTGDLLATIAVQVPQKLSKQARQALEDFAAASGGDDTRQRWLDDATK